jgi:hypothetical protein
VSALVKVLVYAPQRVLTVLFPAVELNQVVILVCN